MREGQKLDRARVLRAAEATDAERLIWQRVRNRQIGGCKFRRQQPVGPYIADFVCDEAGLIVELDGGQHSPERDAARTAYLTKQGFRVLRFWNNDVMTNIDGVLATILNALTEPPSPACGRGRGTREAGEGEGKDALTPTPLPQAGEGLKR